MKSCQYKLNFVRIFVNWICYIVLVVNLHWNFWYWEYWNTYKTENWNKNSNTYKMVFLAFAPSLVKLLCKFLIASWVKLICNVVALVTWQSIKDRWCVCWTHVHKQEDGTNTKISAFDFLKPKTDLTFLNTFYLDKSN